MAKATDLLTRAAAEIGYTEGKNNDTKYGAEYGLNYNPWCVMFLWWIFKRAKAAELFFGGGRTALCSQLYTYHKNRGQAVSVNALQPGDIVFYDFSGRKKDTSHVGIVEKVAGNSIVAIEGNTSSGSAGSQSNGDGVYRRTRNLKYVTCAYRPDYDGAASTQGGYSVECFIRDVQKRIGAGVDGQVGPDTRGKLPILSTEKNRMHPVVATVQVFLFSLGYDVGKTGADGDYGEATAEAVKKYQRDHGLDPDGEIGAKTWAMLTE